MVKRFNITKEGFKNIRQAARWNLFLREYEIDKILGEFPKEYFDKALELGCGSGEDSKYIARYCKKLIALEYNESRLTECNDEKTTFVIGDAQDLSQFGDNEMNLIFSSNLIEHLPNIDKCLAECRRVAKKDGLIIHTVPNRTWKFFHLLLYYPFGIKVVLWRLFSENKSMVLSKLLGEETDIDSSLRPVNNSLSRNLLPKTHGISKSHIREFMDWAEKRWTDKFKRNGLEIVEIIRLPFYFGWGNSFRCILRLGNYMGLSSSTAFVLRKVTPHQLNCVGLSNPGDEIELRKRQLVRGRLLMLNYEFPPIGGGAGNAHVNLLKQYTGSGLKVDVLTSAPKPGFSVEKLSENFTIYKVGLHKKDLHFWRKQEVVEWLIKARFHYRKMLRGNDYDLVHAFFGFPTGWLCYKSADKVPYIISLRGSDVPGYNIRLGLDYKLLSGLFRRIWSSASAVVANSKGLQKLALQFMPDLDIKVIPNGIDMENFYPSEKHKPTKPLQALTVCRLITRKRIDLLIEAVSFAKKSGFVIQLNIAGEGNLMGKLRGLTQTLAVADIVNFMGRIPVERMPQVYRDNDILVMSSAHEGMSNAMLEAMASGLPIITTRCEGVEELVGDNGIVVERAEASEIAAAIKNLAGDEETYKKMSIAARKRCEQFSWKSVAERYLSYYDSITKGTID